MTTRPQRFGLLAVLAVLLLFAYAEAARDEVVVEAVDGTEVVIRLDPDDITEWSGAGMGQGRDVRRYGVSEKPPPEMPQGNPNEVNMTGTVGR